MSDCKHVDFEAQVNINRMLDTGMFAADVSVKCAHCGEKFCFIGAPAGVSYARPMVSVDGTELRCPIEPQGEPKLYMKNLIEVPPGVGDMPVKKQ